MSVLFAILLFSMLIFVHELGHFLTAKLSGVQVNEFSMFMGPTLWSKKIGETLYSVRLIPIGGYCAMEGDDEDSDNPRSFGRAAWWKRILILAAGAAMNFLVGVLLMVIIYLPAKQAVVPSSAALKALPPSMERMAFRWGIKSWSWTGRESMFSPIFPCC